MNIFYTSKCPIQSARNLCLVHVRKMLVESLQMLSTAHHILNENTATPNIYKATHKDHPSTLWLLKSDKNYNWLWQHANELHNMYNESVAYKKLHASKSKLSTLSQLPNNIPLQGFSEPPAVVSDVTKSVWYLQDTISKYQYELNLKYNEWITRKARGLREMKVEYLGSQPSWLHLENNV